jgi:hypothetical protein
MSSETFYTRHICNMGRVSRPLCATSAPVSIAAKEETSISSEAASVLEVRIEGSFFEAIRTSRVSPGGRYAMIP